MEITNDYTFSDEEWEDTLMSDSGGSQTAENGFVNVNDSTLQISLKNTGPQPFLMP